MPYTNEKRLNTIEEKNTIKSENIWYEYTYRYTPNVWFLRTSPITYLRFSGRFSFHQTTRYKHFVLAVVLMPCSTSWHIGMESNLVV